MVIEAGNQMDLKFSSCAHKVELHETHKPLLFRSDMKSACYFPASVNNFIHQISFLSI